MFTLLLSLLLLTTSAATFCMDDCHKPQRREEIASCDPQPCCVKTISFDQELEKVYYDSLFSECPSYARYYTRDGKKACANLNHEKIISWVGKKCAVRSSFINPHTKEWNGVAVSYVDPQGQECVKDYLEEMFKLAIRDKLNSPDETVSLPWLDKKYSNKN